MKMMRSLLCAAAALAVCALPCLAQSYRYARVGKPDNVTVTSRPGFALMGGGSDLDEAFKWLCERGAGGDLVVLRSHGSNDYNPYIAKLCHMNSVATLVIGSRVAAEDPFVASTIAHASAIFIAGGDQGEYTTFWMRTPVQTELNAALKRGVPIGGTSAGLAVLGQFIYTSLGDKPDDPNLDGKTAMADPYGPRITLDHDFLDIPILKNIITDTHFAKRDRMGRLLTFLARLNEPDGKPLPADAAHVRGIGVQERAAVLLEPDGEARVIGRGGAYFVDAAKASGTVAKATVLTFGPYDVQKVAPGHAFNVKTWSGDATRYSLSVEAGTIRSTQQGGKVY
jgi:cyanophycinase